MCPNFWLVLYIDRTKNICVSDQLFVYFANSSRGRELLSSGFLIGLWSLQYLSGIWQQRTRLAQQWACALHWGCDGFLGSVQGMRIGDICAATSWGSPHTFVMFIHLDATIPNMAHSVLLAGSRSMLSSTQTTLLSGLPQIPCGFQPTRDALSSHCNCSVVRTSFPPSGISSYIDSCTFFQDKKNTGF